MDDAICTFDIWPKYRNDSMIPLNGVACEYVNKEEKTKEKKTRQIIKYAMHSNLNIF